MTAPVARAGTSTVSVEVDAHGAVVALDIDRGELGYGGSALATSILALYTRAHREAAARWHAQLLADGVPSAVADRVARP